ncbi:MAG: acylphosphatase [bacterium]|jgi:acylphosphatase
MGDEARVYARVHGVVQGVGFRHFARTLAESFGIKGYVRNVPDGSVEVVAEGDKQVLKAFLDEVKIGPRFGSVSRMDVEWLEAKGDFSGFTYRF